MSRRRKKQRDTIKIDAKPIWEGKRDHAEHRSGSGEHKDRRTKRQRTRHDQFHAHLTEIEYERRT